MKVVSPKEMALIEQQAYRNGLSEYDFMEEAGNGVALIAHDFAEQNNLDRKIILLCGKGNNAGDAFVAGTQLLHLDYEVIALQPFPQSEFSHLCSTNYVTFINDGGQVVEELKGFVFPESGIIIDGLFGTGFQGEVPESIASLIAAANKANLPIIAIDIPSGLNGETGEVSGEAITATITAFLELPKMGFFLRDGWNKVGNLIYVSFGLPKVHSEKIRSRLIMLSPDILKPLLPPIVRNRHKYDAGHIVGLAGSKAMPGAGLLSSLSSLCSGAGIVHLLYPKEMEKELSTVPYELIKIPYSPDEDEKIVELMNRATATFIGPGIGHTEEQKQLLKKILPRLTKPCVLDADALNIIAENKLPLPSQAILTPHMGEMKRLLKISDVELDMEFLEKCYQFAVKKGVTLILKGGPSFVFQKDSPIYVNPKGDPGMATAGSGDVLTGLLASLLGQGLTTLNASLLGVYIHGIAGERAAMDLTSYCMTASDIISYFPDAFRPNNWEI